MGMLRRHVTSSRVMIISPTCRWKLVVSSCHLYDNEQMNPWEMFSYLVFRRGVRPDAFTSFQNHWFSSLGWGINKLDMVSFLPCEIPFILWSFWNWNTKKKTSLISKICKIIIRISKINIKIGKTNIKYTYIGIDPNPIWHVSTEVR